VSTQLFKSMKLTYFRNPTLEIKSEGSSKSFASICTDKETYKLVVHQTSNNIYVIQPNGSTGVHAMALSGAILEMVQSKEEDVDAAVGIAFESQFDQWHGDSLNNKDSSGPQKVETYNELPFSTAQIDRTWTKMCCWEENGGCCMPTSQALLKSWSGLLTASSAESIPLDSAHMEQLWTALQDEVPKGLFNALMQQAGGESERDLPHWVAWVLLRASIEMERAAFLDKWTELVPKAPGVMDLDLKLEDIKSFVDLSDPLIVRLKTYSGGRSDPSKPKLGAAARKWHERFKKT
jgi:hypothetical protein